MAVVFLSQSSRDENKALEALKLLEEAGIPCWYAPRDTQPGANYALEIPRAIEECSYFVLLLSNESQESPYVKLELDQAIKRKKAILPVLLEQMQQTEDTNFFLNAKQAVDGTKDFSAAIRKVIARINGNTHVRESHPDYICCPRCGKSVQEDPDPAWSFRWSA